MWWLGAGGVAAYNHALEVVILAHSEGEMEWLGAALEIGEVYLQTPRTQRLITE